jgi:hypothetical protein
MADAYLKSSVQLSPQPSRCFETSIFEYILFKYQRLIRQEGQNLSESLTSVHGNPGNVLRETSGHYLKKERMNTSFREAPRH